MNRGFLKANGAADVEARRPSLILDRTWAAFDGDQMVATLRSFPCSLTVPGGGALTASAVTAVTTTSTHRRRGLASRLIAHELAAASDRQEHLCILIAAEWEIYGRFGFGAATEHQSWSIDSAARLRHPPRGSVEYVERDTARAFAPDVYDRHRVQRPGEMSRLDRFWDIDYGLVRYPSQPEPKASFHIVARAPSGAVVGVARYETEERWEQRQPAGKATVSQFVTCDPLGDSLLWLHLVNLDLVTQVEILDRPADELLPWLLADARDAKPSDRFDFLWIRPIDLGEMLSSRTYLAPGQVVIEVVDPAGLASGRVALNGGPDGATCKPTTASADLTVDVSTLGSIYLGGYPVRLLAAAGLIDEHATGAVATADAMFRSPIMPWCSTWF